MIPRMCASGAFPYAPAERATSGVRGIVMTMLFGLPDIDFVAAAQSGLLDGLAGNFVATVSA